MEVSDLTTDVCPLFAQSGRVFNTAVKASVFSNGLSAAIAPFETRKNVQINSRQNIAVKAVQLIQPGQVVFIDGGTTTTEMVRLLPKNLAFTAITHSPGIAVALVDYPLVEVIMVGGQLYRHSVVAVGSTVLEAIARINADLFFMGGNRRA